MPTTTLDRTRRKPLNGIPSPPGDETGLWSVVLAGGDGVRLRPLVRHVSGDQRPKQYARLLGTRSLLQQTLDRLTLTIPLERTLVLGLRNHLGFLDEEFTGPKRPRVIMQPENRGTGAAILFAAHWISWREPGALVAVFPVDHFIRGESAFMSHVMGVATFVRRHPERLVLLAATPTEPDPQFGWIEPGALLGKVGGESVLGVRRFREKPSAGVAKDLFDRGHLVNTFILVATTATLVAAGKALLPALTERLQRIAAFANTEDETLALAEAYTGVPRADFSRAILEACPPTLAAARLPGAVTWADWGTPGRVVRSLRQAGITPRWLPGLDVDSEDPAAEARPAS
jgi:mannose-1-phosphate guanylyltransferase